MLRAAAHILIFDSCGRTQASMKRICALSVSASDRKLSLAPSPSKVSRTSVHFHRDHRIMAAERYGLCTSLVCCVDIAPSSIPSVTIRLLSTATIFLSTDKKCPRFLDLTSRHAICSCIVRSSFLIGRNRQFCRWKIPPIAPSSLASLKADPQTLSWH